MPLFQQSVQKKFIKDLDKAKVETAYQKLIAHFGNFDVQENIRKAKEEQYQEGFLRELFVDVLGYVLNPQPNYNLITEQKNEKDSKKADGAILKNTSNGFKPIGIIELKSAKTTDLQSIEIQAFNYKNNQTECVYVVTSNFQKLRFYIENAVDFEEFDLFDLSKERFELLYLCLQVDNILSDLPLRIKQASLEREENITKKLYADYSLFKQTLFKDISNQNKSKGFKPLELFKKTQKLLDRFLFIFFAEDKGLLPPNSVSEILNQWDKLKELDEYQPLYSRFKKYFGYLNSGYVGKQHTIFAYNGGLFAPDDLLDNLNITDGVLYQHCRILSHYDFDTEVDTNILGHIFEHSLNEVDEVAANTEGVSNGSSNGFKPIGKRKKDGIFYTPRYITKYIVESTVGGLCKQKKITLGLDNEALIKADTKKDRKLYQVKIEEYRQWLLQLTILDPACGSGAFLNQALEFLIQEHRLIDTMTAMLFGDSLIMTDNVTEILENNIFGVDINEESVEIARLSLWLRTAKVGRKLNDLSRNIKVGNSLISDPSVAGDLAFDWHKAFPQVFRRKEKEGFHVVLTTHNSRISKRMIALNIEKGEPLEFNLEDEIAMTKIMRDVILEKNYNCIAYNICKDHIHLILVCEFSELTNIVKTIKGKSAYLFNRRESGSNGLKPIGVSQSNGLKPIGVSQSNGFQPIEQPVNHVWSQKFFRAFLDNWELAELSKKPGWLYDDTYLDNAISYVRTNRNKHNLPQSDELDALIASFCKNTEGAYATEMTGGFDVVIGNPPYVRQELLGKLEKEYYIKNFQVGNGVADLYVYFYEKALSILKQNGILGYITPNKFIKSGYGKNLRTYLIQYNINQIIDFGELPVFADAATFPCIVIVNKEKLDDPKIRFAKINSLTFNSLHIEVETTGFDIPVEQLTPDNWQLTNNTTATIFNKMKINALELSKYLGANKIQYGIKTGFNEAFVINEKTKNELILKTPEAAEIIKPFVVGDNIRFYKVNYEKKYLILTKIGVNIERYSSIFEHLKQYQTQLEKRYDKGKFWWELRACDYYSDFEQPKIIYPDIAKERRMTFDDKGYFLGNTAYFIPTNDKFLLAILNSKLIFYYYKSHSSVLGDADAGGRLRWFRQDVEKLPIPKANAEQKQILSSKADQMLELTSNVQKQTNRFFKLFDTPRGLNPLKDQLELTVNKKMETWYELTFGEFRKELEKQKIAIPIKELMDYQELFDTNTGQIKAIQTTITHTERAIDKLVYALYDLTEEEIQVIENQ